MLWHNVLGQIISVWIKLGENWNINEYIIRPTNDVHPYCRERLVGPPSHRGGIPGCHCLPPGQRGGERTQFVLSCVEWFFHGPPAADSSFLGLKVNLSKPGDLCVLQVWFDIHSFQKHNGGQNLYVPVTMSSVRKEFGLPIIDNHKLRFHSTTP